MRKNDMQITKPTNHYSPSWGNYWEANPALRRGVGADAVDDMANDDVASDQVDAAEFERVKAEYERASESLKKLEANNQALLDEKKKARQDADAASREAAKKNNDIESLEKSYQEKYNVDTEDLRSQIGARDSMIANLTAGAEASRIAGDIALKGSEAVLVPHLLTRMKTEYVNDKPVVRILDASGQPSALTIDDLKKEFSANPAFAPVLVGSKASGDSGAGSKPSSGATISRDEWRKKSATERMDITNKINEGSMTMVD